MVAPRKPFRPVDFSKQGEISAYEPSRPSDRLRRGVLSMFAEEPDPVTRQSRTDTVENLLSMFKAPAMADAGYDVTKAALQPSMRSALTAGGSLLGVAAPMPGKAKWAPRVVKEVADRIHPRDNYLRLLEGEAPHLYRETSGSRFLDMLGGNYPYGAPREFYSETPELALGQGNNRGLTFKIDTKGIKGKTSRAKPMSEEMYRQRQAEFLVDAQPSDVLKNLKEVTVTKDAFTGLSRGEAVRLQRTLDSLEKAGVTINRKWSDQ